ncbi:MAG: carboxypeptidase regulatory-like domain-containing protein [Desulfobulbus sp.]|jgi:nickel transport protein
MQKRIARNRRLAILTLLLAMGLSAITAGPAWAHKVNLFAYAEKGIVYTESYFADGRKVQDGQIQVRDAKDALVLTGTTDSQGLFSFPVPAQSGDLTIILDASMGHKTQFILKQEDL